MPAGQTKGNALARALNAEIETAVAKAVKKAMKERKMPTSKEIKKMTRSLQTLSARMTESRRVATSSAKSVGKGKAKTKSGRATCSVRGCDRKHYAKGMCASHYNSALRRKKLAEAGKTATKGRRAASKASPKKAAKSQTRAVRQCSRRNCNEKHYAKGLCKKHYMLRLYNQRQKARAK